MLLFALIASSCSNGNTKQEESNADSTVVVETLENNEVNQMMDLINSVSACLDSVQVQEKIIFSQLEGTQKEKLMTQLASFKDLLARKQAQIDELTAKNKSLSSSTKTTIKNLQSMIEYLNDQLADKCARIEQMEELMQKKDVKIDELRYNVSTLTSESEYLKDQNYEQDKELNSRYYCVASKDELKQKGLLKGGFMKKTKVDNNNVDKSLFKRVDGRYFKSLQIESKNPKILTGNPEASYTLVKNDDGTTTLNIIDEEKFWAVSNFLIIQQ